MARFLPKNVLGPRSSFPACNILNHQVQNPPFIVEPFRIQTLYRKMINGEMNPLPAHTSSKCKNFINEMLNPDPLVRPTAKEASMHEWLKGSGNNDTIMPSKPHLNSQVVRFITEKLDFIGNLNDVVDFIMNNKPSRALAAYVLFKQKFEKEADIRKRVNGKGEVKIIISKKIFLDYFTIFC